MTFNSGLTGFNLAAGCPSGSGSGRCIEGGREGEKEKERGRERAVSTPIHPVSICRVTIVPLKNNVWQEKQGTRRSCIATISVSTTCRLNYFRKWRPFESRAVSAVSRTTRRDKQKFGDTRRESAQYRFTFHHACANFTVQRRIAFHVTRFSLTRALYSTS